MTTNTALQRQQQGLSLMGLIMLLFVFIIAALLVFKVFPPYMEYFKIKSAFEKISTDPEFKSGTRGQILAAFERQSAIDDFTAVDASDIEISKEGSEVIISASYSVKVPLFYNINLLIDFKPTSAGRGS